MARTRTLDPGRTPALHYAATPRHRHAKRLVYASLSAAVCAPDLFRVARAAAIAVAGATAVVGLFFPAVSAAQTGAAVPCVACQEFTVTPAQAETLAGDLGGARVLVRVDPREAAAARDVSAALAALTSHGARAGVHLAGAVPASDDPALQLDGDEFVFEPTAGAGEPDADRLAFDLKRALSYVRGRRPAAELSVAIDAAGAAALRARGLDAYVDRFHAPSEPLTRIESILDVRAAPSAVDLAAPIWRLPGDDAAAAKRALERAAALQTWFPEGLVPLNERALTCGSVPLRTYLNPRTLDLVAVGPPCGRPATPAPASTPAPAPGTAPTPGGALMTNQQVTSDVPGATVERIDAGSTAAYRVRGGGGGDRFAEGVDVTAGRTLSVEEIVARHQAAAARQAAEIETEIDRGTLTITFEAPGFVAPVTIAAQTTIYRDRTQTDLQEAAINVNGAPLPATGGVPRLPIIEPERAASPPLAITLTDVYRYRLAGREPINGRPAYVVAFSPRERSAALYEGRAWIDAATFGMTRVAAVQTGLRGAITASEQTDDYARDAAGHWLLARSDVRQTYEGAGFRTPIHRLLLLEAHDVNAADFAARRAEAYRTMDVMLRDTPQGFRYLARVGSARRGSEATKAAETGPPVAAQPGSSDPAERRVVGRLDRIRTFAFGVLVDPNISVPLPFAGLAYADFNLFGRGGQMNAFLGGTYGQLSISLPSVGRSRWQLAGRAFGIATSYNDRAFDEGREQYDLDIRQRPAAASVWLLRPLSPRTAARLEYDWDYNRFARGDSTSAAFVVPRDQNAHGVRLGVDMQRAGLQVSVWASAWRRVGWQRWGLAPAGSSGAGAPAGSGSSSSSEHVPSPDAPLVTGPPHATYERAGVSALRSIAVTPRLTTRIEAAVMTGWNLDRFSRYSFGTFDNRLHGYPSALIRYDRGAVMRTAVAWAPARYVRVDGFLDTAEVRDPGFGSRLRNYTGVGAALESPAPFGSLLAFEWGYGLKGVNTDGSVGTNVFRIAGYKMF